MHWASKWHNVCELSMGQVSANLYTLLNEPAILHMLKEQIRTTSPKYLIA